MYCMLSPFSFFFFFNDTATTEIYTLSLHDALPLLFDPEGEDVRAVIEFANTQLLEMRYLDAQLDEALERAYDLLGRSPGLRRFLPSPYGVRSEEHTSELQSLAYLVCRLLLEKKK